MPQNTNLNVAPYYDDFNANKNYHRVLFKPGNSIQARELTTLQSILQDQIEKFGRHLFKDGSMIVPGNIGHDLNYSCVEINSVHLSTPVSAYLNELVGKTIKGEISNVLAKVENVLSEGESERRNITLYIKYLSSDQVNFINTTFVNGENLIIQEEVDYPAGVLRQFDSVATTISNNSTSIGSAVKIASGIYFIRGFFVNVPDQTLILDQYDNTPSYKVGLFVKESIAVASNEYNDLLDNSQGFYNFAAPGADRLVISVELIKKSLDDLNDENFIHLLTLENGEVDYIVNRTEYDKVLDEIARRTYDESGDYYIQPFQIEVKESLNNYLGNNGIYPEDTLTKNGNTPSGDLACINISPGKAYVRGYEVEKIRNTIIDYKKPRITDTAQNQVIQFNFGTQVELNNVYGYIPVGLTTNSYVKLFNSRTNTVGVSTGKQIGVARIYDLKLQAAQYTDASSVFDASLYDIQTYTTLKISSGLDNAIPVSTYIEGKNSGANGYLVVGITTTTTEFDLYQVSGNFIKNESLIINGIDSNRIIKEVTDFSINDVYQITSFNTSPATFTADTVLSRKSDLGGTFNISGFGTITSSNDNFYLNIKKGDVISYTKSGDSLPTYNTVKTVNISASTVEVEALQNVQNVNVGTLPSSGIISVNDLKKVTLEVKNNNTKLYSKLNHEIISSLDLTSSSIYLRKTIGPISITDATVYEVSVFEGITDNILIPFDEEAYTLVYSDGTIEKLNSQKLFPNVDSSNSPAQGRITLRNLSQSSLNGNSYLTVTYQKLNCRTRKKTYNRCSTLTVNKTRVGVNTVGTGLVYDNVYGRRVEDEVISLNVPEVYSIVGIFESSSENDPIIPSFTVNSISGNIINLIKGEQIVGKNSKAVATLVNTDSSSKIFFCYLNDKSFSLEEEVTFKESGITATIGSIFIGDPNIINSYTLDTGSRDSYFDYSRIVRKSNAESPIRRITVVFNGYSIDSNDTGIFVGVNSYDLYNYPDIPVINQLRYSDILDFRPIVEPYNINSQYSPFDFASRVFNPSTSSSNSILTKDSSLILSYNYYLPRIDRVFLNSNGMFTLLTGVPSLTPKIPDNLDYSLEIATLYSPPYVFDVSDIKIDAANHKRYTMKDISDLDNRLVNVEKSTSLSLLEAFTQNIQIVDLDTKLNKFKSGFFVDNFSSAELGDIENNLYRASVDLDDRILRPQPYSTFIDLELNSNINTSSNIKKTGNIISLNYDEKVFLEINNIGRGQLINRFNLKEWTGTIELEPPYDSWIEEQDTTSNYKWGEWNNWIEGITNQSLPQSELSSNNLYIRSRNIGIFAKSLKPSTRIYGFLDDIDVTKYIVPKLIEVEKESGPAFQIGETVVGEIGNSFIRFRLAQLNHKTGTYNEPNSTYQVGINNSSLTLPEEYSATTDLLNVDLESLNQFTNSGYYGNIEPGMILIGQTSGAIAKVKSEIKLITDIQGDFIGSLFIPNSKITSNPKFRIGTKTFVLSSLIGNSEPNPATDSYAEAIFIANGNIQTVETNDLSLKKAKLISETSNEINRDSEFTVSLAQSFFVNDASGVFLTKCDIFFSNKPGGNDPQLPVTIQIRTVKNGKPTREIVPFSEVILKPNEVNIPPSAVISPSEQLNIPTIFTFKSPVYLEGKKEYCIVLNTNSDRYAVAILNFNDSQVSTNNINIGNLFKSQNTPVLFPSQYEKLCFKLYRADFRTQLNGIVDFYNPDNLNIDSINQLSKSVSIQALSRSLKVVLNKNLSQSQVNLLSTGYPLYQTSNFEFISKVKSVNGQLSTGYNLSIVNPGIGYTVGIATYTNVDLISLTGIGAGAKATIGVGTGSVYYATITTPGNDYTVGDVLTIDYKDTNNLGNSVLLSIPSSSGILTSFNSIVLDDVQGNLTVSSGNLIVNGISLTGVYPSEAPNIIQDGLHFKVNSKNHGMYSLNNLVDISGVESDIVPTRILGVSTSFGTLQVQDATNFISFEGNLVGVGNSGYIKVGKEVMSYNGINTSVTPHEINIVNRQVDNTSKAYPIINDLVFKYEFNGISLRKINKQHSLADVDYSKYSIDLDSYYVKIPNNNKYFRTNKSNSSYLNSMTPGMNNKLSATQNVSYSILRPIINVFSPEQSSVSARVKTYSSTSVNGNEPSFIDKGFEDFSLSSDNEFKDLRGIYSKVNENEYLSNNKSLTLRFNLSTLNSKVSPIIDLDRVGVIPIMNRINKPIIDYIDDSRINKLSDDPNSAIYLSKKINLTKPADSLKVIFDAYRHSSNDIRVAYRVFRNDVEDEYQLYELFPGFGNIDEYGNTVDTSKNTGLPDNIVTPSGTSNEFKSYEYSVKTPFTFIGFQIKIIMAGSDQANVPKIKDLKVIATI